MKFILYCEIPDKDKTQIKNYSKFIEKNTSININNIFINYDDSNIEESTKNKEDKQEIKKSIRVPNPPKIKDMTNYSTPIHKQHWNEYDNMTQFPDAKL